MSFFLGLYRLSNNDSSAKKYQCYKALLMRKSHFFILGACIAGLIQGSALGVYGAFEDSLIYFEFYSVCNELGFFAAVQYLMLLTGKFEPVIMILFALESILIGSELSQFWFLVLNITLMNMFVSSVMFKLIVVENKSKKYLFFIGFITVSTYFVFAKTLYVWRSILAFIFFILFVKESSRKRFLWAIIACLAHTSFLLFILIYLMVEKIHRSGVTILYWLLGIFPSFFQMFMSAGATLDLSREGSEHVHAIRAWLAILFAFILILLVRRNYISNKKLAPLYIFCLLLTVSSLFSFSNYAILTRVSVPSMMIVGFLPYFMDFNNWRFQLARLCVLITMLPTARLLINMFTGTFRELQ